MKQVVYHFGFQLSYIYDTYIDDGTPKLLTSYLSRYVIYALMAAEQ